MGWRQGAVVDLTGFVGMEGTSFQKAYQALASFITNSAPIMLKSRLKL